MRSPISASSARGWARGGSVAVFLSSAREKLGQSVPEPLLCFYRGARALLRARLALAHLTEPEPRTPEKWEPRARQYIRLAEQSLERLVNPRIR